MTSSIRHFVNLLFMIFPPTRLFAAKRALWRICGVYLGHGVSLNQGCRVVGSGPVSIGQDTWVGIDATFIVPDGGGVSVGSNCDIGPGVLFNCGSHAIGGRSRRAGAGLSKPISVGDGVWIGARAVILGGVDIGSGCVVAAGAVVLPDSYPEHVLLAGVPARVVKVISIVDEEVGN